MQETSFLKKLIRRRVPQILGLYIAATWMMIEIGDWMIARFNLSQDITSYIFIGMAFFIPSVFYLAYQYGKPGKDPWKKPTFIVVPGNLAIAIVAMIYLVNPVAATETKIITDEKGVRKAFEVSKEEFRKNLMSFFWQNESGQKDLDWMRYGIAWLLAKDLDRSLFISAETPFSSNTMLQKMKKAGFNDAVKVPKSMLFDMSRRQFLKYSLNGRFSYSNDVYKLTVDVYDIKKRRVSATHSVSGKSLLSLIDELTISIKETLGIPQNLNEQSTDLPIEEHISESLIAIEALINSKIKRQLENDYFSAKQLLEKAVEEDFSFAHGYTQLARTNQLMGNSREAENAVSEALKHEYKLTTQEKFRYRALAYGIRGDYVSQVKIYDMWLELYPDDITAHEAMSRLLLVTGLDHNKALHSLRRLRQLSPEDDSVLSSMTTLFVLNNEFDKAIESQSQYVELNPENSGGLIELANVFTRASQFDKSRAALERVLLLERGNLAAAVKLAALDTKLGNFEVAQQRLENLLVSTTTPRQRFEVLEGYSSFYSVRGQIRKVIETLDEMKKVSQHLPPLLQIFNIEFSRSLYLANLGQFEESLAALENVRSQLQPPIDGIVEVGVISIHILAKDEAKLTESLDKLEVYIRKYPNPLFSSALDTAKAQAREMQGDYVSAVSLHQQSLETISRSVVNTQNEIAILTQKVYLARSRILAGNPKQAEREMLAVLDIHPTLPHAHLALAASYLAQERLELARDSINKVRDYWKDADRDYIPYQQFLSLEAKVNKALP